MPPTDAITPAARAMQKFHDRKQTAAILGVSPRTLRRLVRNKEISYYQPTERKQLFSDEHIAAFLRRREVVSDSERRERRRLGKGETG